MMPSVTQSKRWCFTINNYTDNDIVRLRALSDSVAYLIFGREVGDSGTPHLQGYCCLHTKRSLTAVKGLVGDRAHLEASRGSPEQASDYCKKDGDFEEFGTLPKQGKRSDIERFVTWIKELDRRPSRREIADHFPSLFLRYSRKLYELIDLYVPPPSLTQSTPRFGWQTQADGICAGAPHSRHIHFFVDPVGNSGKSWFCKFALTKYPDKAQVLRIGKRDDLAHAIDPEKSVFLFDVPREQMMYLQYSVLEMLKDQMIFSPKYESQLKTLASVPTVIVFCNEPPDLEKMSQDRYVVHNI